MKKRSFCLFLMLAILVTGMIPGAIVIAKEEDGLRNVSKGCSYTATAPYVVDANKYTDNYRNKNYTELTDGVYGSTTTGSEWYAFYGAGPFQIVVDLGKTYTDIARVSVNVGRKDDWGIVLPKSITVSGSTDNKEFTQLATLKDTASEPNQAYRDYVADVSGEYRYIRFDITSGGTFAFVAEVEVFCGYISTFDVKEDLGWYVENDCLFGVAEKTDVSELSKMANTMAGVKLLDASGKEKTTGALANGDQIVKYDQSGKDVLHTYTVVIDGDVNPDGKINVSDYTLLKRSVMKKYTLNDAQKLAADADRSGKIQVADYTIVKRHVLGTFNLFEKYEPEVEKNGRGDVTEEFKKMDTTDNIQTLTSHDMVVKRNSATEYGITCQTEGGSLYLTLHKTAWGTFNLGKWEFTEGGTTHRFVSDSTDWEYVYRVGDKKGVQEWSGGNHDNEQMVSFQLFDGKTNKEINLSVGQSVSVKNLKIVEKTKLYFGGANTSGYPDSKHYANTVRTYTIVGPQITLAVDYEYVKDAYYGLSYTCMFPIDKDYGLYCAFMDDEELLFVAETLWVGSPNYDGKQYGNQPSNRCVLWGYGGNEKFKFDVRVLTPETSCNNFDNGYVFFWDMNTTSNKLYFSKWSGKANDMMKAGQTLHTECQWNFYIED